MATFMSPLDPCFWLHHANIDRIWAEWTALHPNGTILDNDWRTWNFANNFVDTSGNPLPDVTIASTLSTYALGYRYDTQAPLPPSSPPSPTPLAAPLLTAGAQNSAMLMPSGPLGVAVDIARDLRDRINRVATTSVADFVQETKKAPSVIATIDGVMPPKDLNVMIRVFVNCSYLSRATPAHDPHYVGSICFFEHDHDNAGNHQDDSQGRSYSFDITETLQELESVNAYEPEKPIEIQLLAVPIRGEGAYSSEIMTKGYHVSYYETPA
jgi:tyrosinase